MTPESKSGVLPLHHPAMANGERIELSYPVLETGTSPAMLPEFGCQSRIRTLHHRDYESPALPFKLSDNMAVGVGLEPTAFRLTGGCSYHTSYPTSFFDRLHERLTIIGGYILDSCCDVTDLLLLNWSRWRELHPHFRDSKSQLLLSRSHPENEKGPLRKRAFE